jgi:maltose O-acetyltransferase
MSLPRGRGPLRRENRRSAWGLPSRLVRRCARTWLARHISQVLLEFLREAEIATLRHQLLRCGERVVFFAPPVIEQPWCVSIGDDVSLAAFVHIWGGGGVTIGDRVMIGTHVSISSLTHDYSAQVMKGTLISRSVAIMDDVWLGSNAVILPGVTIGRGAVVGAGAVVTHDVPAGAIAAGVPARILTYRPRT